MINNSNSRILKDISHLFYPRICLVCHRRSYHTVLCKRCLDIACVSGTRCYICYSNNTELDEHNICQLCRYYPLPYSSVRFLWNYVGAVKDIIRIMKYRPSLKLTKLMANKLSVHVETEHYRHIDVILPIPSSKLVLQYRGFNQCEILAQQVALRLDRPQLVNGITHMGYKSPQAALNGRERLKNIQDAFEINTARVVNKNILLVDDVITTGATVTNCSRLLIQAGVASVNVLSLARSPAWNSYRNSL